MEAAFSNQLILKNIFAHLPLRNLKQCRFVSKYWNFEIQSYIRVFRRCDANISGESPCSDLSDLDGLAAQTTALTINGLTVNFSFPPHSSCQSLQNETRTYDELVKKLHLKYLDIHWDVRLEPTECPGIKFIFHLLQENLADLHTLSLDGVHWRLRDSYLDEDWTPRLPNLKVLQIRRLCSWEDLLPKILDAAPNLQKIIVDEHMPVQDILPKEKHFLVDNYYLRMYDAEDHIPNLEFALSMPTLSKLVAVAPSEEEYISSYFDVLQRLLTSSCKTLETLDMIHGIFELTQLNFPALVNLRELIIYTGRMTEKTIRALGSIDYPKMLPVLDTVEVTALNEIDMPHVNPWGDNNAAAPVQPQTPSPSSTVKKLMLEFSVYRESIEACHRIFPHVSHLTLTQMRLMEGDPEEVPYEVLWTHWSQVEFMEITEACFELGENFDAKFLGINQEEVNLLRQMDDESLGRMNIVPIRPSVLTMNRLKSLSIVFNGTAYISDEEYTNPDQVFLSKVTGILALKKLRRMGAIIEINIDSGYISYLDHLRPFVRFANDLANIQCPFPDSGKTTARGKTVQQCSVGTQCTPLPPLAPSPVYLPANVSYALTFFVVFLSHLWIFSKLLAFF